MWRYIIAVTAALTSASFVLAEWDPDFSYVVDEELCYETSPPYTQGAVAAYNRDVVADTVGDRVYVHIAYAACFADATDNYYQIKYRRGYYDIGAGPSNFVWDIDPEVISGVSDSKFKMQPTIAVDIEHRLWVFWSDSCQCDEESGKWENIEIYGQTAYYEPLSEGWVWRVEPFRMSGGYGYSDCPVVVPKVEYQPYPSSFVFWRDGRDDIGFSERTDIYGYAVNGLFAIEPDDNWHIAINGGLTPFSVYTVAQTAIDAACDDENNIHLVWVDKRAGDDTFFIYYKRKNALGEWDPEYALGNASGGGITLMEREPKISVINLSGGGPALDLCVMVRGYGNNYPHMYVYDHALDNWHYITRAQVGFGGRWCGAIAAERGNGVIHTVFVVPPKYSAGAYVYYRRGNISGVPPQVSWYPDTKETVENLENAENLFRWASLSLDSEGVLHTVYRFDTWNREIEPRSTSIRYENDGGSHYVGGFDKGPPPTAAAPRSPGDAASETPADNADLSRPSNEYLSPSAGLYSSPGTGDHPPPDGPDTPSGDTPGDDTPGDDDALAPGVAGLGSPADFGGDSVSSDAAASGFEPGAPSGAAIASPLTCAPNPVSCQAKITFKLEKPSRVKLAVYDLSGRRVATLADGAYAAGEHVACWQSDVPTGVYIYRLEAGGKAATKKVVVAK